MTDERLEARLGEQVAVGERRAKAGELLASQDVGFLAVVDEDGPYTVPISFAYDGENIFFHGGVGKTSLALEADPRACLAVMKGSDLIKGDTPCGDNVRSRTALVFGLVRLLDSPFEKDAALRTIIAKYDPDAVAAAFRPEKVAGTRVYSMEIRAVTYRELPGD
ncbi:MAG: pyridoxamine 5'-phosphate oxidase family protein [Thermoleophilia bacterium]